ncbi:hypothetical protein AX14_010468 [Amanita brunnescens Koide BX004]|nr:hypothetical protein AX14_010468 [Amanita brunnescens Koide BX004]
MEKLWAMRDPNRELVTGLFRVRFPHKNIRQGVPALIRRRKVHIRREKASFFREVKYLWEFHQLKAWAMKTIPGRIFGGQRRIGYIAIVDVNYVSGQETNLNDEALKPLRKNAQKFFSQNHLNDLGTDKNDYVYQLQPDGKYRAVWV